MSDDLLSFAQNVRFDALQYLLTADQWEESDSKYKNLSIFTRRDELGEVRVKVPRQNSNPQLYSIAMADAIRAVAQFKDQDPMGLATALVREVMDLHRLHLPTSLTSTTSASLSLIASSTSTFSKLLHESMLEEADDAPKVSAEKFRNECAFGHTFKGCFGISIEVPTNRPLHLFKANPPSLTAERRANNRIAKGLNALSEAAKDGSRQLFKDSMEDGLTPSMCRTLLELAPAIKTGEFEYEPIWSPFLPQPINYRRVHFDKLSLGYLEHEASPIAAEPPEIPVRFVGAVEKMQASIQHLRTASEESKVFTFGVRGTSEETGPAMLSFAVDRSTYQRALDAHGKKINVQVSCTVKKRTRGWYVMELTSLSEAPPSLPA